MENWIKDINKQLAEWKSKWLNKYMEYDFINNMRNENLKVMPFCTLGIWQNMEVR